MAARIIIRKKERLLEFTDAEGEIKTYQIVLGPNPEGDKNVEGDGRTPEGKFYVFAKNPQSKYYLSLALSYPHEAAARRGLEARMITEAEFEEITGALASGGRPPQKTKLGGEIYIHGGGTGGDWTCGCVALKDEEIAEIYAETDIGTSVEILP